MATPTSLPSTFSAGAVLTAAQMNNLRGAFRVLQVVYGDYAIQTATASSTYADTGLTASITPSSTSNKVLVLVNQAGCYKDTNNTHLGLRLMRGSTEIIAFEQYGGYTGNTNALGFGSCSCAYLDSPSTTSSTTYKTQFKSFANNANCYISTNGSRGTIILAEISA